LGGFSQGGEGKNDLDGRKFEREGEMFSQRRGGEQEVENLVLERVVHLGRFQT